MVSTGIFEKYWEGQPKYGGKVAITDEIIGVSQLLGDAPKSTPLTKTKVVEILQLIRV